MSVLRASSTARPATSGLITVHQTGPALRLRSNFMLGIKHLPVRLV